MVNLNKRARVSLAKTATAPNRLKAGDTFHDWVVRDGVARNDMDALSAAFKTGVTL